MTVVTVPTVNGLQLYGPYPINLLGVVNPTLDLDGDYIRFDRQVNITTPVTEQGVDQAWRAYPRPLSFFTSDTGISKLEVEVYYRLFSNDGIAYSLGIGLRTDNGSLTAITQVHLDALGDGAHPGPGFDSARFDVTAALGTDVTADDIVNGTAGIDLSTVATAPGTSNVPGFEIDQVILYVTVGGARLRQSPRDDYLGGAPRQGRTSRSRQASARQGWRGTYR